MTANGRLGEWYRFLGVQTSDDVAAELRRLVMRLDDSYDALNYVAKLLAGAPDGEVEEVVRIARSSVDEAITLLDGEIAKVRRDGPDAAA